MLSSVTTVLLSTTAGADATAPLLAPPRRRRARRIQAELSRLRREAEQIGDSELLGAADALEKSARQV